MDRGLPAIFHKVSRRRFTPHRWFAQPHVMTVASHFLPRPHKLTDSEIRLFEIEAGVRVLAHCHWQADRRQVPTLVIAHGLEGSSRSHYVVGTAVKAIRAGFNVVRINQRGCGGTHHLSPKPYHAGLVDDLRTIINELIERDHLKEIYLLGFSLGGNQSLKLAAEYGQQAPAALRGVCAVSAPIDLELVSHRIHSRVNRVFEWNFLRVLHRSLRRYHRHYPQRYDISKEWRGTTIRRFDDLFTAPCNGFNSAQEYYQRASAGPLLPEIVIPTLIIAAQDDPFIPFQMYERARFSTNTELLAPAQGGHLGFLSDHENGEDRYWVENRALEFFQLLHSWPLASTAASADTS